MRSGSSSNPVAGRRIVVAGAGIVGVCVASYLQREGYEVTVLDPVEPGGSCSFGNAGGLNPGSLVPLSSPGVLKQVPMWLFNADAPLVLRWAYLPKAMPWLWRFIRASREEAYNHSARAMDALLSPLFDNYAPLLADADAKNLIRRDGQIYAYQTEAAFAKDARDWETRRRHNCDYEIMSAQELREAEPALAPIFERGVRLPAHGYCVDPHGLVTSLAQAFIRKGGAIRRERVRDVVVKADRLSGVVTDDGVVDTDGFVVAAGAWSAELCRKLGHRVPLESQRGYHVTLADPSVFPNTTIIWAERKILATTMSMGLRFAGTVEIAGLNTPPNYSRSDTILRLGHVMFPGLKESAVSRWMGHRPCLPDSIPVIGSSTNVRNAFFAFGHGHVGLSSASTTGRLISELIAGRPPCVDPSPYRVNRF